MIGASAPGFRLFPTFRGAGAERNKAAGGQRERESLGWIVYACSKREFVSGDTPSRVWERRHAVASLVAAACRSFVTLYV